MALISLKHVSKVYPKGTRPALNDITLDIDRGDFVFLVGASGSGKTTLLSLLLREEEATDGEIRVAGNDLRRISNRQVPQYRRSIGFVFQDYKLLNNKTVWQNVAFALEVIGTRRSAIKSLVPKVLETVGLTGKEDSYPHELSGGEQQRVAIARAYVNHPQILLADEPTGNLDPTTSLGIMEVLDAINRTGTTVVMATHNEEIVNSMRKRVVELHAGKIVRDEEHGSYDSAMYFPDAEVTSRAHQALGGEPGASASVPSSVSASLSARGRDDERFRPHGAVEAEVTQAIAIEAGAVAAGAMNGDEGIARLAQSVHSGRTGRYGEAFAPLETTLTWGKGLQLDEMERIARAKEEAEQAKDGTAEPDGRTGAGTSEPAGTDVPPAPPVGAMEVPSGERHAEPTATADEPSEPSDTAAKPSDGVSADAAASAGSGDDIPAVSIPEVIARRSEERAAVEPSGDAASGVASGSADGTAADAAKSDIAASDEADAADSAKPADSAEPAAVADDSADDLLAPPAPPAPPTASADRTGQSEQAEHEKNEEDQQ